MRKIEQTRNGIQLRSRRSVHEAGNAGAGVDVPQFEKNAARITQRYGAAEIDLPLWGNGRIEMLIGAVASTK